MTDTVNVPLNCRQRLKSEGEGYYKSSCAACGKWSPKASQCDAALKDEPSGPEWFGVSGAINEAEALAVALFVVRCPGMRMTDEDMHYYLAAAESALSAVSAELDAPEAPKVEQEPFGYAYAVPNDTYVLLPNPSLGGRVGKPLYAHPAPKVEQEPVMVPEVFWSWLVERGLAPDDPDFDWNDIVESLNEHENELIRPAPASDELLEALEGLVADYESEGVTGPLMNCLRDLVAKYKGPQS
ncbi:hypothetical protein [uncultured Brevundimonas sp.]|uniref:hypothetical protein n=1 Tax=uncultured Brevundimonas sp. TaxID=213418 RepID=UPI00260A67BC|nr:hypothetical protein [uncultured Brevundimonas sp.]